MFETQRPLLGTLLLAGYLLLGSWSLVHMGHMVSHGASMEDCPYLMFQHADDGTLSGHLALWQHFMLISLPLLFVLVCARIGIRLPAAREALLIRWHPPFETELVKPPIKALFAKGILHPKAP